MISGKPQPQCNTVQLSRSCSCCVPDEHTCGIAGGPAACADAVLLCGRGGLHKIDGDPRSPVPYWRGWRRPRCRQIAIGARI